MFRFLGGDALQQLKNPLARRVFGTLNQRPVLSVALLRVLMQTAPSLNVALALTGVKLRDYVLGTLLGLPLPIALYCVFFDFVARSLNVN